MRGNWHPAVQRRNGHAAVFGRVLGRDAAGQQFLCRLNLAVDHLRLAIAFAAQLRSWHAHAVLLDARLTRSLFCNWSTAPPCKRCDTWRVRIVGDCPAAMCGESYVSRQRLDSRYGVCAVKGKCVATPPDSSTSARLTCLVARESLRHPGDIQSTEFARDPYRRLDKAAQVNVAAQT